MKRTELLTMLRATAPTSEKTLADGTVLLGHVPVVAPLAYLHSVFAPLSEEAIEEVEQQLRRPLPLCYVKFLKEANGLHLFAGVMSFLGVRAHYERNARAASQPHDIVVPNVEERPRALSEKMIAVGYYRVDGSLLVMNGNEPSIALMVPDATTVLRSWVSVDVFLAEEVSRLALLLGPSFEGARVGSGVNTLPRSLGAQEPG